MLLRDGSELGFRAGRCDSVFPFVFAGGELAAQEFADGRPRNGFDEHVAPRPFVIGEARPAAEFIELFRLDLGTPLDEGGDDLAPALVGKPDHGHLRDGGMQRQAAFDLDR